MEIWKELCYGNYARVDGEINFVRSGLNLHEAGAKIEAIPLTEEWLKAFGFKLDKTQKETKVWSFPRCFYFFIEQDEEGGFFIRTIEKVLVCVINLTHHLQNTWLCLTDTPLTAQHTPNE